MKFHPRHLLAKCGHVLSTVPTMRAVASRMTLDAVPDVEILASFESLGDSCEFATLQKIGGVDHLALFQWSAVPLGRLAELLDDDLRGVDDPQHVRVRLEARPNGPGEYMLDHSLLQSPMHTFQNEGDATENRVFEREIRRLTILRRKFIEDARAARRIYVYRSLAPRPMSEVVRLHQSLRRLGANRLLFVRPPGDGLQAGTVRRQGKGFAVGALDDLAVYEAATAIRSKMWPLLLRRAYAVLR